MKKQHWKKSNSKKSAICLDCIIEKCKFKDADSYAANCPADPEQPDLMKLYEEDFAAGYFDFIEEINKNNELY